MNKFFILLFLAFCVSASVLDEANAVYSKGHAADAILLYKKAANLGENPTLCYFNLANSYYQLDSIAAAVVYYKASLSGAPDFFRAHLNLAAAYYALDEIGECIASISRALKLEPGNQKAMLILAVAYRRVGACPEAICTFERLAAIAPEKEEAFTALGEMYSDLFDNKEAIKWFEQYPQSGKNSAAVLLNTAELYESENDPLKAGYYLKKSFERDTTRHWTYYRMVMLDIKSGNVLSAFENAKEGVRRFPRFAEIALLAGNIAFNLEKYYEADQYYHIAKENGNAQAIVGLQNVRAYFLKK